MCVTQTRRNLFRLEFDQTRQALDDRCFADAGFADEHWRIRAFAVREYLHHLQDLAFAADGRGDLVLTGKLIERDAKMPQE